MAVVYGGYKQAESPVAYSATGVIKSVSHKPAIYQLDLLALLHGRYEQTMSFPEIYTTVVDWKYGTTTLYSSEIYQKFQDHKGDTVEITYHKVYETLYDHGNNNENFLIQNKIVDITLRNQS